MESLPYLDGDDSLRLPCHAPQQPLTVFVRHQVLQSKRSEFNHWCKEIYTLAGTYDGFINAEVIKPVSDVTADPSDGSQVGGDGHISHNVPPDPDRMSDTFVCIVRFQNYALLKRWIDSNDRRTMIRRTNEFSYVKSIYSFHSLEHGVSSNINDMNPKSSSTGANSPPKWKMIIMVTSVMYLQTLWIPRVTGAIFPNTNSNTNIKLYVMGLLNMFFIVALVTYIIFPITRRLLAFWLFPNENYYDKLRELIPSFKLLSGMIQIAHLDEPRT